MAPLVMILPLVTVVQMSELSCHLSYELQMMGGRMKEGKCLSKLGDAKRQERK